MRKNQQKISIDPMAHIIPLKDNKIIRNFKSMYTIANMYDLKYLAKFSMVCRSFYWIAGRKSLLTKFYKKDEENTKFN